MTESEAIREKRKFAIELKQLVHQKCVEINHYVSGCDSPFSYLQIADVQESLGEIENTLNIKAKGMSYGQYMAEQYKKEVMIK